MKKLSDFSDSHLRIFDRPPLPEPEDIKDVYLIGVCGTGMGSLAGLFADRGYRVLGSDAHAYPPMSTRLREQGIEIRDGYNAENIKHRPSLTIVGNACTPTHPEATVARDNKYEQASFPEALAHYFIGDKRSVVVAGTHGKTTTTALLAHIFSTAGLDPGYLVGGILKNTDSSFRNGDGDFFIVEGDEYDSAYFDKDPKFFHYKPFYAIVTSLEYDHADIYSDLHDYVSAFSDFAGMVSPDGLLVLNGDLEIVTSLADHTLSNVVTYGSSPENFVSAADVRFVDGKIVFSLMVQGVQRTEIVLPMVGKHNLGNALAACAVALHAGISPETLRQAFASFKGIRRRQEIVGSVDGIEIIDDFAHHPTAVKETVTAFRQAYGDRRIVAIFEPRSNSSRRKAFEIPYVAAFANADVVMIKEPPFRHNDSPDDFMNISEIVDSLNETNVPAESFQSSDDLAQQAVSSACPGDVILIMSNGGFDGIHQTITDGLQRRKNITDTVA